MIVGDINYKFSYVRIDMDFPMQGARTVYLEFSRSKNGQQIDSYGISIQGQEAINFYADYDTHIQAYIKLCEKLDIEYPGGVDENEYGAHS